MADVEVQLASEKQNVVGDREELVAKLDHLLEQYLITLDAYQRARQLLTERLSSGFMSLAQANFTNTTRTRYGQDYYDERMQASRKVVIDEDEGKITFTVSSSTPEQFKDVAEGPPSSGDDLPEGKDAEEYAPDDSGVSKPPEDQYQDKDQDQKPTSEKIPPPNNPLRWFGVLVPPALRSAQASFTSAVTDPVVTLSTLQKSLKNQEIEIGRVRKQIKKL